MEAFALTGRKADCSYTQGVTLSLELLPFQGVLLAGFLWRLEASALSGRVGGRWLWWLRWFWYKNVA